MFAKLAVVIISLGVVACILLAVRQQRVQAAHELAEVQRRVMEHDRTLWYLRTEIAERVSPQQVDLMAKQAGVTAPINRERLQQLVERETKASQVVFADDQ
jgi:cell division protein FtsL